MCSTNNSRVGSVFFNARYARSAVIESVYRSSTAIFFKYRISAFDSASKTSSSNHYSGWSLRISFQFMGEVYIKFLILVQASALSCQSGLQQSPHRALLWATAHPQAHYREYAQFRVCQGDTPAHQNGVRGSRYLPNSTLVLLLFHGSYNPNLHPNPRQRRIARYIQRKLIS